MPFYFRKECPLNSGYLIRLGGEMDKEMIAIRIGPDIPMAIVGSPDYFLADSVPTSVSQLNIIRQLICIFPHRVQQIAGD